MSHSCPLQHWVCTLILAASVWELVTAADRGYGTQFGNSESTRDCTGKCNHRGNTYNAGEKFSYTEGCIKFNCECHCNGWYDCPREKNEDICRNRNTDRTGPSGQNCKECNVHGVLFPSNAPFNYNRGCTELSQCHCHCNGFWNCTQGRDICRNTMITQLSGGGSRSYSSGSYSSGSSSSQSSGSSSRQSGGYSSGSSSSSSDGLYSSSGSRGGGAGGSFGSSNSRCRQCLVSQDRLENPNTYFKYRNGCSEWDSCFCNCEGRWSCDDKTYKKVCGQGGGSGVDLSGGSCTPCDVYGKIQLGNTDFVHRNGCHEWTDCHCSCGGSFYCSNTSYRWACDNICRECSVDGRKYAGNTEFSHTVDCITYDPCQCHCNGSWSCPPEAGKWTCTDRCRECDVDGNRYQGNSEFRHKEGCWEWDHCQCNCNGSWKCPKEHAKWTCSQQCRDCVLDNQTYAANSPFTFERGDCYRFHCQCGCNGSYECPPEKTENTCLIDPSTGCYPCDVHGKTYKGQSVFNHTDGCMQYQDCICNCNGFWECPGSKAVDTCHPHTSGSCYTCDVNGNKVAGGSRFTLEDGDWRFDCECYCNGGWQCSAEAIYTGDTSHHVENQCKDCYFLGRRHTSRTSFDSQWGCIKYKCQCNCDGKVECPVEQATSVCSSYSHYFQEFQLKSLGSTPVKYCSACKINDHFFPGNSQFEYVDGCHRHMLRCYCNSGYRVAKKIIDSCVEGIISGTIKYSKKSAVFLSVSQQCDRKCIVNGIEHASRSSFEIYVGCSTYRCQCACNGLPQCQAPIDRLCNLQIHVISNSRITGGSSSSSHVGGVHVQSGGSTVVNGGSHSSRRVISGGSSSRGTVVSGGSRRVITGSSHSSSGGVISGGGSSSSTRIVSGGSRVVGGGSRVVSSGSRVVSGGSSVVSSGSTGSSRVIRRRIVSTGGGGGGVSVTRGGSTSVVIRDNGVSNSDCHFCVVEGRRYHGMAVFDYKRGCVRYRCQCDCKGYAICRAVSINECFAEKSQCRPCYVENKRYEANSRFTFDKDCQRTSCRCECDGMATCVRTQIPGCTHHDGCLQCVYNGVTREPNTQFNIDKTCERTVCQCNCNGQVQCSSPFRTCAQPQTCGGCTVEGHYRPAKSTFTLTQGNWRMTCTCECDNRYTCDRANAEYIGDDSHVHDTCRSCTVDGKVHQGKTKFQREQGCYRYSCQCFCDGTHNCVSTGTYICSKPTTPAPHIDHQHCKPCRVGSQEYPSEQPFSLDRSCKRYNCECYCSGRYGCQDSGENTCHHGSHATTTPAPQPTCTKCHVQGKDYSPNTKFTIVYDKCRVLNCKCSCDGTHDCDREVTNVCGPGQNQCRSCTHDGVTHQSGKRYRRVENCVEYDCECGCDGSPRCSALRRVCHERPQCRSCTGPDGQEHQPYTQFLYDKDCLRYTCDCACNGSYNCPSEKTRRICPEPTRAPPRCRPCTDPNGRRHPANSQFTYDKDCQRHRCNCACDGTYNCPSGNIRRICRNGENKPQCRPCTDPVGRQHRSGSEFIYDKECHRYTCTCDCSGEYNCPAEKTINYCDRGSSQTGGSISSGRSSYQNVSSSSDGSTHHSGSSSSSWSTHQSGSSSSSGSSFQRGSSHQNVGVQPSHLYRYGYSSANSYGNTGCFYCVAGGAQRKPNERFVFDDNCYRFSCFCACNGSWECPASQTQEICKSHSTSSGSGSSSHGSSCRQCTAHGKTYAGNSHFQHDDGCYRLNCDCYCNGSWNCPADRTKNICTPETGNCRKCNVQGYDREPNSRFQFDKNCFRFDCDCNCDGSYVCPAERTRRIPGCGSHRTRQGTEGTNCTECVVQGSKYRSGTRFQYVNGCAEYDCDCFCDGSFNCPPSRTVDICRDKPNSCTECEYAGTKYPGNSDFVINEKCSQIKCSCDCEGKITCKDAINTCTDRGDLG
ncbi:uncharacterized protein LOC133185208 [Saccostrea echinata]|uniref:uncharacterized protein LOC133185208 n=1 Tax=Saccostrea echinata TaxID=191078 RepID=UPI002A7F2D57|nr:uncharacterized protein LOC133185208 [Saccostrea echinata]